MFKKIINQINHNINTKINLIPSENIPFKDCINNNSDILSYKYAEGYPNNRYYNGCKLFDEFEIKTQQLFTKIFKYKYINVQPHSGSQANQAAILGVLNINDTILSMKLNDGSHLTHGCSVNIIGKLFNIKRYQLNKNNLIDYELILKDAKKYKPKMIICGFTSYPREFSFKKFSEIAKKVNAILLADISHIAGIIAAGYHNSPFPYADIVTTTTHKTLKGPRGGIIMTNNLEFHNKIKKMLFPGLQGGPLMNNVINKGIAAKNILKPYFNKYIFNVINNMKIMEKQFIKKKIKLEYGGTDTHMLLIDTNKNFNKSAKYCADILEKNNIIVNVNKLPKGKEGIRIGTPFMTSLNKTTEEFKKYANKIIELLK